MAKRKTAPPDPIDENGRLLLWGLLTALIGDSDRVQYLPVDLRNLDYPKGFEFEFEIVHALYTIHTQGGIPEREDVLAELIARNIPDAEKRLDALLARKANYPEGANWPGIVKSNYIHFENWRKQYKLIQGLEAAAAIARNPMGRTPQQMVHDVQVAIQQSMPLLARVERYSIEERHFMWMQEHARRLDRMRNGKSFNPTFSIAKLNQYVPGLNPGDPVLFSAQTGHGKTTFADFCAEWWAWEEGYYVLVIPLETSLPRYHYRFLARHTGIPTRFFTKTNEVCFEKKGHPYKGYLKPIDVRKPFWSNLGEPFVQNMIQARNTAGGKLIYSRLTGGATAEAIISEILDHYTIAQSLDMELVVVVDYLGKIHYEGDDERLGISRNVALLKDAIDSLQCYAMLLTQESEGPTGKKSAFGSRNPQFVTQTHLSLVRPPAEGPEPIVLGNRQAYNAMHEARYFTKEVGSATGANAYINILKANDGLAGPNVPVLVEGELFSVYDPAVAYTDSPWAIKQYELLDLAALFG